MKISKYLNCFKGLLIYLILSPFLEIIISRIIHPHGFWFSNIANLIAPVITTLVLVIVFQDFFKEKFKDFQKNWQFSEVKVAMNKIEKREINTSVSN